MTEQLRALRARDNAKAAGLVGKHLLERGDPAKLAYSFTLYERTEGANRLRVQADNLDQPFDLNAGAKLELGSTAKLRTLITYLEIVAELHRQYAGFTTDELSRVEIARRDRLTRWALDHLAGATDKSLQAMLDAAMQRRYSANPGEVFFTGGHAPGRYSLADRGYLAHVHPLELWVAAYRSGHPDASLAQVLEASRQERQQVYGWLFQPRARAAQDTRIATLLELDAFAEIHRAWQRLGYPFEYLVSSYATAIGSSGDRPAALAELMGIIVNDGLYYPTVRIERLRFGAATPYETVLERAPAQPVRVLAPEIAATVRQMLEQVVEQGTARRLRGALDLPDGTRMAVGGKTGTGDNRGRVYAARGRLIESHVLNRTATFVFFIGARHFGTVTAYVPGPDAQDYRFTSALPVQLLKSLVPLLRQAIAADPPSAPGAISCTRAGGQRPRAAVALQVGTSAPARQPSPLPAPVDPGLFEPEQAVD